MAKRRRLGSVLGRLEHVLERLKRQKSEQSESAVPGTQLRLALGKHNIYEEENLQTSTRPPYAVRRHAAGPLRARCGSKAQQSCLTRHRTWCLNTNS